MADDNKKKNIATPQSLPADFANQADEDNKRHKLADEDDQSGELDVLGEDQDNEPLDIDDARKVMGLGKTDPEEIDTNQQLKADDQATWEN
jgi:hypothetical protein